MALSPPLLALQEELNKTAVISDEFKQTIMHHAFAVARDAYQRGARAAESVSPSPPQAQEPPQETPPAQESESPGSA